MKRVPRKPHLIFHCSLYHQSNSSISAACLSVWTFKEWIDTVHKIFLTEETHCLHVCINGGTTVKQNNATVNCVYIYVMIGKVHSDISFLSAI